MDNPAHPDPSQELPPPDEKLLRAPTFFEKNLKYVWLLIPLLLVLSLIAIYISSNKTQTQPATQILAPTQKPNPTTDTIANWQTFSNKLFGMTFKYPDNWSIVTLPTNDYEAIEFKLKQEPMLVLSKYDNPDNLRMEQLDKKLSQPSDRDGLTNSGFSSSSNKEIAIDGKIAYKQNDYFCEPTTCERYILITKNSVYTMLFFPTSKSSSGQILSTFKFLDQSTSQLKQDQNCAIADYSDETADWKTYTNPKYKYSFKYPNDAISLFNNRSDAPQDYNDAIGIIRPSDRAIYYFNLSIVSLEKSPENFTYFKTKFEKVDQAGGEWPDPTSGNEVISRTNFLNQTAYTNEHEYEDPDGSVYMNYQINLIRNDVLFRIETDQHEYLNACQILSTFKFLDQKQVSDTTNWKTVSSLNDALSFKYPAEWVLESKNTQDNVVDIRIAYTEKNIKYHFAIAAAGSEGLTADKIEDKHVNYKGIEFNKKTWIKDGRTILISLIPVNKTLPFDHIEMSFPPEDTEKYLQLFDQILSTFKVTE